MGNLRCDCGSNTFWKVVDGDHAKLVCKNCKLPFEGGHTKAILCLNLGCPNDRAQNDVLCSDCGLKAGRCDSCGGWLNDYDRCINGCDSRTGQDYK